MCSTKVLLQLDERLPVNEFAALRELAGPPPGQAPNVDWAAVQARLGFGLPADYRAFADTYGPGTFGDVRIAVPGGPAEMDLFALLARKYDQIRDLARHEWDAPVYPEPGGMISWGETTSGYTCAWAPASADPDQWTVVVIDPSPALNEYTIQAGMSFSTVLKQHAEQEPGLDIGLLPPRPPSAGSVTFTPYPPA